MLNKNDIDLLLLKYLQHETTATENETVEEWLLSHPKHQAYFRQFRQSHIYLQATFRNEHIQGHYSAFMWKLRRRSMFRLVWRIAAVILVLLGSGVSFYLIHNTPATVVPPLSETTILPGSPKAILHLSSGESIAVKPTSQEFMEKDGTMIRVSDDGTLDYSEIENSTESLLNRLEIPRGGEFKISLTDGTEVWLNSETELQYPTVFTTPERRVRLNGEAYFKVAKNEKRPFIVEVEDIEIKVYGTQFNINTLHKNNIETVLVNGSISIRHHGQETLLRPSQKAAYSTGKLTIEDVNVLPYTTWKDGNFMFHNESLESIMEKLARWYDLEVFYVNDRLKNIRLSGMMERYKNADELFHYFEKISTARFITKGRTVTIQ